LHNLAGSPEQAARAERLRRELVKWRDELGDARTQGETFWKGYRKTGLAERVRSWFRQ
jgi:hypothetical protein